MTLKPGSSNPCGASSAQCTMADCETMCTGNVQEVATNVRKGLSQLGRVKDAIAASEIFKKWSTCNGFFDHILTTLGICNNLPKGVTMLAVGFLFVMIGNVAGIIIFSMGSKRFFDRARYERGSNAGFGQHHANMNGTMVVPPRQSFSPFSPTKPEAEKEAEMALL